MNKSAKDKCLLKRVEQQEIASEEFGFYWSHIDQLIEQIKSECIEIQHEWRQNNSDLLQEEIGDLIQAAVSLAVFCKFDPHETLQKSIDKYQRRLNAVIQLAQKDGLNTLHGQTFEVLMDYWNRAKAQTK